MENDFAKITVDMRENMLSLELEIDKKQSQHELIMSPQTEDIGMSVLLWILNSMKPLFFEMPLAEVKMVFPPEVLAATNDILPFCSHVVKHTNDAMIEFKQLKGMAEHHTKFLFYNVSDNHRYVRLYEKLRNLYPAKALYQNFEMDWDPNTRRCENNDVPLPLPDLIEFIAKEGIKKIVSINHYLLERYLKNDGIYLPALFRHLGVEYIIIDNDNYDTQAYLYLLRSFFHCNSFQRFSTVPLEQEPWDRRYALQNIHYIGMPQDYQSNIDMSQLDENYGVLVLSNSRIDDVKSTFAFIIYLLDHFPEDNLFTELQLWCWSLRHLILEVMNLGELERLHYNSIVHNIFYSVTQFLKYEIIDSIDTTRKIEIYGDSGWEEIFPEYYQNKYLGNQEMNGLFAEGRHLHLLLNHSITYPDAAGPIQDAMSRNLPFINWPTLVKTKPFKGLRHIEYNNKEKLNYLIDNIRTVIEKRELMDSMEVFRETLVTSTNTIEQQIVLNKKSSADEGVFAKHYKAHKVLLHEMIQEYIEENEPFLRETFRILCLERSIKYNLFRSKYSNRRYVQAIMKSIKKEDSLSA